MRGKLFSSMTFLRWALFSGVQDCVSSFSLMTTTTTRSVIRPRGFHFSSSSSYCCDNCTKRQRHFSRNVSTAAASSSSSSSEETSLQTEPLLHPEQFGEIPMPKALSPSAVLEFKKCPQSFLFQYLYKLRQPKTLALAKGSMCHEALEKVFDLDPDDRTLEHLQNLLRVSWGQERLSEEYAPLFENESGDRDISLEKEWGESALQLLENYYRVEDPKRVVRPNPLRREIWLHSHLTKDPALGRTAVLGVDNLDDSEGGEEDDNADADTFYVRGIIDRLDMVRLPGSREVALKIVDYKTGKAPNLKYSRPVNERIVEEAFYQLKVYALLFREKGAGKQQPRGEMGLRYLQLLYLNSDSGDAKPWEYDLGETQEERDIVLNEVHQDLAHVWKSINELVKQQDPKAFVGCDRSFCYCHKCRNRFVDGTLWKPN